MVSFQRFRVIGVERIFRNFASENQRKMQMENMKEVRGAEFGGERALFGVKNAKLIEDA